MIYDIGQVGLTPSFHPHLILNLLPGKSATILVLISVNVLKQLHNFLKETWQQNLILPLAFI